MRLAFISQAPTPYLTPILNELAQMADLDVIFMSGRRPAKSVDSWATFRDPWRVTPRFRHSFFPSLSITFPGRDFHVQASAGVSLKLFRLHPDVVLVHGWGPLMVEPIIWRVLSRRRAVMWTESTSYSGLMRGRLSNWMRRSLVRRVDALVSNGTMATEYAETLGADPRQIITGRLAIQPLGDAAELTEPPATGGPRILFVGRLVPRKRLADLLAAFTALRTRCPGAMLTVVGDGPLRNDLEESMRATGLPVSWLGRLEGARLGDVYAAHDLIVVPSEREVWGLVVNEALAAGLYVVASSEVASARDLLGEGLGTTYPVGDVQELTASLEVAVNSMDRSTAGRSFRRASVQSTTAHAFAVAMRDAAELAAAWRRDKRPRHG